MIKQNTIEIYENIFRDIYKYTNKYTSMMIELY